MKIGGLQRFSLIDYPEKISAVVFTQGCMFRCRFCHNAELVDPKRYKDLIDEQEFFDFLTSRKGKLDGVVVSGGEPAIHKDLPEFLKKIKDLGFLVKLDTTGYFPKVVNKVLDLKLVDYIAMDIKAPLDCYKNIARVTVNANNLRESIELIKSSNVDYEFRTTIAKKLTSKKDVFAISEEIKGAKRYVLQKFVSTKTLDPVLTNSESYSDEDFIEMHNNVKNKFEYCFIR